MRFLSTLTVFFLIGLTPVKAQAAHVTSKEIKLNLNTNKVAVIEGEINDATADKFGEQVAETQYLPGPLLVLIDSPGGSVDAGQRILDTIKTEKLQHTQVICLVVHHASSMAFNTLSTCDVRLATPGAFMLCHKIATLGIDCRNYRCTANHLREEADSMDVTDYSMSEVNRKALHMTKAEYNQIVDEEHVFFPSELLFRHYLHGIATVIK